MPHLRYKCVSAVTQVFVEDEMNRLFAKGYRFIGATVTDTDSDGPRGIVIMEDPLVVQDDHKEGK